MAGDALTWLTGGESGFLVGFLVGVAVGVALCRWLWIDGQMKKAHLDARRASNDGEDG